MMGKRFGRASGLTAGVAVISLGVVLAAKAAGFFTPGFPLAGSSGYPALNGSEQIPADTLLAGGASPQSVAIPLSMLSGSQNKLYGGDLDTALSQRLSTVKGIASLAAATPTAAIVGNDGWWYINQSSQMTVTIASGATEALPALSTTKAVRIARPSGQSPTTATCTGQTLDQATSASLIGRNATFSFWALNGATMSAANGAITASIAYSSGTQAAATQATLGYAGSQGSKYALGASGQAGTPTNYTVAASVLSPGYDTGAAVASGVATIPLSTTWTRYAISAPIPLVIPSTTTAVTDVSVSICFNPVATTSVTTDWIELQGMQLESTPAVVQVPGNFDKRPAWAEQQIDYYYWYYLFEAQAAGGITTYASCESTTTTVDNCLIRFPVPMRLTPVVKFTDGFQVFTTAAETAVNACNTLALSTSYATVANNQSFLMTCTATAAGAVAGQANFLTSLGTTGSTGIISASALP